MKKLIVAPLLLSVALSSALAGGSQTTLKQLEKQVAALQAQIEELKASQAKFEKTQQNASLSTEDIASLKSQLAEVKQHDAGDNIKWTIDFRTAYDNVRYKINNANMPSQPSKKHNGIWTNKLILGMTAQPTDNLVFRGSLGMYKAFGQNNVANSSFFQNFDWYDSQKPNDSAIRLREAYFLYYGNMGEVPYQFSFGRRPSSDGFLTNLRADNAEPASPIGHNINMEFDGASFKFDLDKVTGIDGLFFKLCLGRGFSDTTGAYSMNMATMGFNPGYVNDEHNPDMDLAGLIAQFYDDGQYKVMGNYFYAKNMMDMNIVGMRNPVFDMAGNMLSATPAFNFVDVGDMQGGALSFQVNGIGEAISDFLDDTTVFASWAFSKTKPNDNPVYGMSPMGPMAMPGMLGSTDSKFGSSIYLGVRMPGLAEGHKFGLEYNHGSKYWRSFTYGEDTLSGSKLAARGDAYEAYYVLPIVSKHLTAQLSYLYVDYDYTGSDTFFGWTGTPMDVDETPGAVKSAQQIRASLRYRY